MKDSYKNEVLVPVTDENMNSIAFTALSKFENAWTAQTIRRIGNTAIIEVVTSANALVSEWSLRIEVSSRNNYSKYSVTKFNCKEAIYILFDPWSKSRFP